MTDGDWVLWLGAWVLWLGVDDDPDAVPESSVVMAVESSFVPSVEESSLVLDVELESSEEEEEEAT